MADPNKKEKEEILSYFFVEDVDPSLYNQSYELRQELSSSLDGIAWFLSNYPFEEITTYVSAFECFKFRLAYFPDEFDQEFLNELKIFLFDNLSEILQRLPPESIPQLSSAQAYLAILIFPRFFSELFEVVFQFPDNLLYLFLSDFCEYLILPTPSNAEMITSIKTAFDEIQFYEQIFLKIEEGIHQKKPEAIDALASFTRWSKYLDYLENNELLEEIFSDTSIELAIPIMNFIGSIAQRDIPEKTKDELIQQIDVGSIIINYCENYSEEKIIFIKCAELLSLVGYSLKEPIPDMLDILSIFLDQPEEISEKVLTYFRVFVRSGEDKCEEIANKVVKRLISYFDDNPIVVFNRYLSQLLLILLECCIRNPDVFYEIYVNLLTEIKEAGDEPDCANFSAFIAITNLMFQYKIEFKDNLIDEFFVTSKMLFGLEPPLADEKLFFPLYGFIRTFLYRDKQDIIANQYNQDILKSLSQFSLDENLQPEAHNQFEMLFLQYVQYKWKFCPSLISELEHFFESGSQKLIQISGYTLNSLMGKRKDDDCIKYLEYINNELLGENVTEENALLTLSFLSSFETNAERENEVQIILDIYSKIIDTCKENDELLGKLCISIKSLGEAGFQYFSEICSDIHGVCSLAAAADITNYYYQYFKKTENEEIQNDLQIAFTFEDMFINSANEQLSIPQGTYEIRQVMTMIKSFYNLYSNCLEYVLEEQEVVEKLLDLSRNLLIKKFNIPQILAIIYNFLFCFALNDAQFISSEFTNLTFNFILSPSFDPDKAEWESLLRSLMKLHSKLAELAYQKFSEQLSIAFQNLGLSSDFIQEYNQLLEPGGNDKFQLMKSFFVNVLIARNSLTW